MIVQHFEYVLKTSFQSKNLLILKQFYKAYSPFFNLNNLIENGLISIIESKNIVFREIGIHVKICLAQNLTIHSDPATWTDNRLKLKFHL